MRLAGWSNRLRLEHAARIGFYVLAWTVVLATAAVSQSLTAGEITGDVTDASGNPVSDPVVTLVDIASGVSRTVTGARDGHYYIGLVVPGEYQLLVEHLGYRPVRVLGVVVPPGVVTPATVTLALASPPVTQVDTARLERGAGFSPGDWFSGRTLRILPDRVGDVSDVARLSSSVAPDLAADGDPGSLGGFLIDGIPYRPAHHPDLAGGQIDVSLLELSTLESAGIVTNGGDIEWSGFGGSTLSAFSRQGTPGLEARFAADATSGALSSSQYFNPSAVSSTSFRGAFLLSGPVSHDSGQWVVGVEGRRLETPLPAIVAGGATFDSLSSVAQDSFKVALGNYLQPRLATTDALTAFTGLTWQPSASSEVTVDARYATVTNTNPDLGVGAAPSPGATLNTRDLATGATLTSSLSPSLSQEARLGFQSSSRVYGGTNPPLTEFADLGMPIGSDPTLPGEFERTAVRASETIHYEAGAHRFKFGLSADFSAHDMTYGYGSTGAFDFSGPSDFAADRGVWTQTDWVSPSVSFSVPEFGFFAQDLFAAGRGFDILLGLRLDAEQLPQSDVVENVSWLQASGLDNAAFPSSLTNFSPRLGFTWDPGEHHTTGVRGLLGVYYDEVDPGLLGEAIATSLGDTVHRALGSLGAWPNPPSPAQALAVGPALTLLAPQMQAPRTGRAELDVRHDLGGGVAVRVSGAYAHTDYLPERTNLNLPIAPTAYDQYGRPIYGTLVQQGALLAVQPGTNSRFAGFDVVSGISPTSYSDYWGLTFALERQAGTGLHLLASYTYSQTTDNWLSGLGGGPAAQLSPFPQGLNGQDWANGPSDFDIPHRFVLSGELQTHLPLSPLVAVVYRLQSGAPFTPGFPAGVDVSGTGAANNPAFVDPTVPGMSSLLAQWGCLQGQTGQFAARNSCRDPAVQSLDLRLTFDLVRLGGTPLQIVIDGLNVLESDVGVRDHALVLVDPTKALITNPAKGTVTVPLVANPDFGNVILHTPGRELRIGVRSNF